MKVLGPLVVAVSGTSGAGKSTLVANLSERLHGLGLRVETVQFDDFFDGSDLQGGVSGWLARGGQLHEWRTDRLEQHLLGLLGPFDDEARTLVPASVVVVEEPFGRARPGLDRLVDLSVHLRVPLHVALARGLLRQYIPQTGGLDQSSTADLRLYLNRYLAGGADFYSVVEAAAAEHADLVLDGLEHSDALTTQALTAITRQLPGAPNSA